jgi:hypothetical protein
MLPRPLLCDESISLGLMYRILCESDESISLGLMYSVRKHLSGAYMYVFILLVFMTRSISSLSLLLAVIAVFAFHDQIESDLYVPMTIF